MSEAEQNSVYTLTIFRRKQMEGCLISYKIYLDGNQIAVLKNGQTAKVQVPEGVHQIHVNKYDDVTIEIHQDTECEAALVSSNNISIINISNQSGAYTQRNEAVIAESTDKKSKYLLYAAIAFPVISIIMLVLTDGEYIIGPYWYIACVVLAIMNLRGLSERQAKMDPAAYASIHKKNVISLVLFAVFGVITLLLVF